MKVPELGKVESVLLIAAVGAGLYVAWKMYSAGSTIKGAVGATMEKVADTARTTWDNVALAAEKARTATMGADAPSPDDQGDAESARLQRQNAQLQYNGMPDLYDPNGNVNPAFDPTQPTIMGLNNEVSQPAMEYSPDPFTYA